MKGDLFLKKTALNENHRRMRAKMVKFAGWEMPVFYTGIIEEQNALRTKVGLTILTTPSPPPVGGEP